MIQCLKHKAKERPEKRRGNKGAELLPPHLEQPGQRSRAWRMTHKCHICCHIRILTIHGEHCPTSQHGELGKELPPKVSLRSIASAPDGRDGQAALIRRARQAACLPPRFEEYRGGNRALCLSSCLYAIAPSTIWTFFFFFHPT